MISFFFTRNLKSMPVPSLPMELWARVAFFLPFTSLITVFWSLRRAGALPYTGTHPGNALLQFCSEVSPPSPIVTRDFPTFTPVADAESASGGQDPCHNYPSGE